MTKFYEKISTDLLLEKYPATTDGEYCLECDSLLQQYISEGEAWIGCNCTSIHAAEVAAE